MGNNVKLHLSESEHFLFEQMWACENKKEFNDWMDSLGEKERATVVRILDRLILEVTIEVRELDKVTHLDDAKYHLMKYML